MKNKMKKEFFAHIEDGLDTMLSHIEKRMDVYKNLYDVDNSFDKNHSRKAIMKDISAKLPIGRQYMWFFSSMIRDELKAQGGK